VGIFGQKFGEEKASFAGEGSGKGVDAFGSSRDDLGAIGRQVVLKGHIFQAAGADDGDFHDDTPKEKPPVLSGGRIENGKAAYIMSSGNISVQTAAYQGGLTVVWRRNNVMCVHIRADGC